MGKKIVNELKSLFLDVLKAFIIVWLLTNFVIINANVPTGSMENTIPIGARLFASRLHTTFGDIERKDIIIFKYPDNQKLIYVKRVIGLPGDTVEGKDGEVYVNGDKLEEDYIKDKIYYDFGPYNVPEDSYFMLGDNRLNSNDSRYWNNTFVDKDLIMGKAIVQYYPDFKKLYE